MILLPPGRRRQDLCLRSLYKHTVSVVRLVDNFTPADMSEDVKDNNEDSNNIEHIAIIDPVSDELDVTVQCDRLATETAESLNKIIEASSNGDDALIVEKFVKLFREKIRSKLEDNHESNPNHLPHTEGNGSCIYSDYSDTEPEQVKTASTKLRPFFRRFSFKGIKKARALSFFHKQESDEAELSTPVHTSSAPKPFPRVTEKKSKLSKIIVECQKEGLVNLIADVAMDGSSKWEKSKMVLVKATGGFMLEFYCPPKMSRPKTGVFCFLLSEARETTALEMPDKENTFVLKTENHQEYIVEAPDSYEMRNWLTAIQCCMRQKDLQSISMSSKLFYTGGIPESQSMHNFTSGSRLDFPSSVPSANQVSLSDLPPRIAGAMQSGGGENDADIFPRLSDYPWFHGMLSRGDAAAMVLHQSITGHGVFLVRQSETRRGEYVLTFNFQGRAKHIRMAINPDGQCRVQNMWFNSIFDMLEHFRVHSIPLESGASSDCTLTEYAVRTDSIPANSQHNFSQNSNNTSDRSVTRLPEPNEVLEVSSNKKSTI